MELNIDNRFKSGLAHRLILKCNVCETVAYNITCKTVRNTYKVNTRYMYALRSIVKGLVSGKLFSAVMYTAPLCTRGNKYTKSWLRAASEVCDASTRNAASEAMVENEGNRDVFACFDGS